MDSPLKEENLRALSYPELKKIAKLHGIKANMKGEKIISNLLSGASEFDDSFLSAESQIMNSSKKNKQEKFDKDKEIVSETPRRDTYTVENPEIEKRNAAIMESASPEMDSSNITFSRGSERKLRSRTVSFVTPVRTPRSSLASPKLLSLKDRPKTPIASKVSVGKRVSFATPNKNTSVKKKSLPSTPHPMHTHKKAIVSENGTSSENADTSSAQNFATIKDQISCVSSTPLSKSASSPSVNSIKKAALKQENRLKFVPKIIVSDVSKKESNVNKRGDKNVSTPASLSVKRKRSATPNRSTTRIGSVSPHPKSRAIKTPDFKAIHQKAFEKMESIDEYQKRKEINSAKKIGKRLPTQKKLPPSAKKAFSNKNVPKTFSGIPFIPSVINLKKLNLNFSGKNESGVKVFKATKEKDISLKENTSINKAVAKSQKNKTPNRNLKFDLKASLSRKLPYKPHSGPLKPLIETNLNSTMNSVQCFHQPSKNGTIQGRRVKSREVVRGVRTNRRFELQMSKRI